MKAIKYFLFISLLFQSSFQGYTQTVLCETQYKDLLQKCYQRAELYTRLVGLFASTSDPEELAKYKQTIYALFEDKEAKAIVDDIANYSKYSDSGKTIEEYLYIIPDHLPADETTIIFTLDNPTQIHYDKIKDRYFTSIHVAKKIHKKSSTIHNKRIILVGINDIKSYAPSFNIIRILNGNREHDLPGEIVNSQDCVNPSPENSGNDEVVPLLAKFTNETILTRAKLNLIQWKGGPPKVNLYYFNNTNIDEPIVQNIPNNGLYRWKIPSSIKAGYYKLLMKNNRDELMFSQNIRIKRKFPLVLKIAIPITLAVGLVMTQLDKDNIDGIIGIIPQVPDN